MLCASAAYLNGNFVLAWEHIRAMAYKVSTPVLSCVCLPACMHVWGVVVGVGGCAGGCGPVMCVGCDGCLCVSVCVCVGGGGGGGNVVWVCVCVCGGGGGGGGSISVSYFLCLLCCII